MHTPHVRSGGRYPVLRTIAILYLIGGAAVALAALVGAVWSLFGAGNAWLPMGTSPNWADRMISFVVLLAGGFFAAISMFAIAEVLKLFIDVEHNTRMGTPGRIGLPAVTATTATTPTAPTAGVAAPAVPADGGAPAAAPGTAAAASGHTNRLHQLDEESAEAALLRGH